MDKINELIEKRAKLWEEAKNFLDTHTDEDGKLSAEDAATYEKMEADVVDMKKSIDRLQRQAVIDRELDKLTSTPITNEPSSGKAPANFRATDEYRKEMLAATRSSQARSCSSLSKLRGWSISRMKVACVASSASEAELKNE